MNSRNVIIQIGQHLLEQHISSQNLGINTSLSALGQRPNQSYDPYCSHSMKQASSMLKMY